MTKEEILDKCYGRKMLWKSVNRERVLAAMEEYAQQELSSKEKEIEGKDKEIVWLRHLVYTAFLHSICDLPDDEQKELWDQFAKENNL